MQEEAGRPGKEADTAILSPSPPGVHLGFPLGLVFLSANHLPVIHLQSI